MELVVGDGKATVVAIPNLETYLSAATGGIAVDRVPAVLAAIRRAASGLRGPTMSPDQLDEISTAILQTASSARALAEKADPADPDAQAVLATLAQLGL